MLTFVVPFSVETSKLSSLSLSLYIYIFLQLCAILLVCMEPALPMTLVAALRDTLGKGALKQVIETILCNLNLTSILYKVHNV